MPHAVNPWPDEEAPLERKPGEFRRSANGTPWVADPTRTSKLPGKKAELIAECARRGIGIRVDPDGKPKVTLGELHKLLGGRPTFVMYGRPSSLGKQIENTTNLQKWSERAVALGIYVEPKLLDDLDAAVQLNLDDGATKDILDGLAVKAKNVAQAGLSAERGTHGHALTEDVDLEGDWLARIARGEDLGLPEDVQRALVDAWEKMLGFAGFEILKVEAPCVDDIWRQAGTLDRIVRLTRDLRFITAGGEFVTVAAGTVLILDIKTGKLRLDPNGFVAYWHSYAPQLASYAQSKPYDPDTDTRGEWPFVIDQQWAIIAHLDILAALDGEAKCRLVLVDLEAGREAGALCVKARQWEKRRDVFSIPTDDLTVSVSVAAGAIRSPDGPAGASPPAGSNIASTSPVEEPPVAPPTTVEAAPTVDTARSTVGAEPAHEEPAERRKRLLARHKALSSSQKLAFRQHNVHPADLETIERLLDELENPPSVQALAAERMASDAARVQSTPAGDIEGGTVTADEMAKLEDRFYKLGIVTRDWFKTLVSQANDAGVGFVAKPKATVRRYELYRGLIALGEWFNFEDHDDCGESTEVLEALVYAATADDATRFANVTPGHALGSLNVIEATAFANLVDALIANRIHYVVLDDTERAPELVGT